MRLIDADALADNIAVLFERNPSLIDEWLRNHIEDEITEAPTIDAEPVKYGKWLYTDDMYETLYCSKCGYDTKDYIDYHYCPQCGAKMHEVNDEVN